MDYEQYNSTPPSQQPVQPSNIPPYSPLPQPVADKPKKHRGWKIFWGIFTSLSVIGNIMLILMLIGVSMAIFLGKGPTDIYTEEVITHGPKENKIAVINLYGIIDGEQSEDIYKQLKNARRDNNIKGLILRVNSPGGMLSPSDEIYHEICKFRRETNKPVVAFMQGLAASGGYYASVACDKIVAEQTTITGSVGVIMAYMVVQELLEGKLGIRPIVVKSGLRKDWPSSFTPPTEEQLQYLHDKVITPAYERFLEVVSEGRKDVLTPDDVRRLSDGSIFSANEALSEKLIDRIGYLDDAIDEIKTLAGIEKALVVEYVKPFSLSGFLRSGSEGIFKLNRTTLYELSTPQALYLWSGY